jgi:DNA damage-binding protein 1
MDVDNESEMTKNGYILGTRGSYLSVLDTQKNIAPIMDAVLVDIEGTGQVCPLSLHIPNHRG